MLIHSPVKKDKKVKPNVRRKGNHGKRKKRFTNPENGSDLIYSPNNHHNGATQYGAPKKKNKSHDYTLRWPKIKPWKVIVGSIIIGLAGLLYLNHVFETQKLLREVDLLKQNYTKEKLIYDNRKFTYDRMTGPAEIYNKAKKLGMINGGPADKVVIIKNP